MIQATEMHGVYLFCCAVSLGDLCHIATASAVRVPLLDQDNGVVFTIATVLDH